MRNYEGMRLPPTLDPHTRNELLKVDKFLKQLNAALAKSLGTGNSPGVRVITGGGGTGGGGGGGGGGTSTLPVHTHGDSNQGGRRLGDPASVIFANGKWVFDGQTTEQITLGLSQTPNFVMSFAVDGFGVKMAHAIITWNNNVTALSPPTNTGDLLGCKGARLYLWKDATSNYDMGYGQDATDSWVLVSDNTITYSIFTGVSSAVTPFLRAQWDGNGDLRNYGIVHLKKSTNATYGQQTPALRLEETGAGTDYIAIKAPAAVTATHTLTLPGALPASSTSIVRVTTAGTVTYDATIDNTNIANRTRSLGFNPGMMELSLAGATLGATGTHPDNYDAWYMTSAANSGVVIQFHVPADWVSGTDMTIFAYTTKAGGAVDTAGYAVHTQYISRATSESLTSASTNNTPVNAPSTTTALMTITNVGTIANATLAAGEMVKLQVYRDTVQEIADNLAATNNTMGLVYVRIDYTADM